MGCSNQSITFKFWRDLHGGGNDGGLFSVTNGSRWELQDPVGMN